MSRCGVFFKQAYLAIKWNFNHSQVFWTLRTCVGAGTRDLVKKGKVALSRSLASCQANFILFLILLIRIKMHPLPILRVLETQYSLGRSWCGVLVHFDEGGTK